MRRLILAIAGGCCLALTPHANAALFFLFRPTTAQVGQFVQIRTGGTPASFRSSQRVRPFQQPMRLYLVENSLADEVVSRFDDRLHPIGVLVPDKNGHGVLRFRVPSLAEGEYAAAVWCPGCARYSNGRTFFALKVDSAIVLRYRPFMLLHVTR